MEAHTLKRHISYLKAVLRHKWFVFLACFRFGVPLWTAILHDWDKFLPDEWFAYAKTFYKSDGSKQYVESVDFAYAWMLHQHRNKHHWQYWLTVNVDDYNNRLSLPNTDVLVWDRGEGQRIVRRNSGTSFWYELRTLDVDEVIVPKPMPDLARREMLADWFGAGRAYNADWTPLEPRKWYEKNREKMILHPETRAWVEAELLRQEVAYERELWRMQA